MRLLPCCARACAVLVLAGRVLVVRLLLDLVMVAYVHEMAALPADVSSENDTEISNASLHPLKSPASFPLPSSSFSLSRSSSSLSSSSSPPLSSPAVSKAAGVPLSLSSSSSSASLTSTTRQRGVSHKHHLSKGNGTNVRERGAHSTNNDRKSESISQNTSSSSSQNTSTFPDNSSRSGDVNGEVSGDDQKSAGVERHVTARTEHVEREFPMALVVASSAVAVSVLVFFCLSYLWHTRQLDRRAQKLAIRLAAEANSEMNCTQCRAPSSYARCVPHHLDSGSDSGAEEPPSLRQQVMDELDSLKEQDELGDSDEVFAGRKPGGVGRTLAGRTRGRNSRGGFRKHSGRSSKKWSSHSASQTRSSLITDQEILNHFASRRHSTFFI